MRGFPLAVEVSGRASRRYDRDYKRDAYLALGVREVWLVDLDEQCVLVSRAGAPRDVRSAERLTWHPPGMPEPLVVDLDEVFRGVLGGRNSEERDGARGPNTGCVDSHRRA